MHTKGFVDAEPFAQLTRQPWPLRSVFKSCIKFCMNRILVSLAVLTLCRQMPVGAFGLFFVTSCSRPFFFRVLFILAGQLVIFRVYYEFLSWVVFFL